MRSTTYTKDSSSKSGSILSPTSSGDNFDLEDYIYEMQRRNDEINAASAEAPNDDIYAQLAQKEKDLILAAELGKALLERNQELTRQNERMTEEFSTQLEVSTHFFISILFFNKYKKKTGFKKYFCNNLRENYGLCIKLINNY